MCCFSVCFFKARDCYAWEGGAVGFSATAFIERRRPSVQERCVRMESVGRKVWSHESVAKDGSAFSLPFKMKRARKKKILPGGWPRFEKKRRKDRETKKQNVCERKKCEKRKRRKKESRWNLETFRWRLKAIHVRSINQKEKSFLTHTHKSFWENNNHFSPNTQHISRTHNLSFSHPHSPVTLRLAR